MLPDIYQGNSTAYTVKVVNSDGTPVDITGKTIIMTIAPSLQETPVIQKVNVVHADPTNGITIFPLTKSEIHSYMPIGTYSIDFTMLTGSDLLNTLYVGTQKVAVPVRVN
jgi:hypothetical protein